MRWVWAFAFVAWLAAESSTAIAVPTIDVGTHVLQPGTSGQSFTLQVSGGDMVTGFNLRAQLGDGLGPQAEPVFTGVSFAGTLWAAYPYWVVGGPIHGADQFAQASVLFSESGQGVTADGLLVTLTIDTTGFTGRVVFPLRLSATDIAVDSDFILQGGGGLAPTIHNGVICVGTGPGDADLDGVVGRSDLLALEAGFGRQGAGWAGGDFNLDGQVDWIDYLALKENFGRRFPGAVPEPTSCLMLGALLAGLLHRKRARHLRPGEVERPASRL
jgi:hypothetical protein